MRVRHSLGAPAAKAAPAHLPLIPVCHSSGEELRGCTQQAGLVHVAVKMRVQTLFTLGLCEALHNFNFVLFAVLSQWHFRLDESVLSCLYTWVLGHYFM